MEWVIDEKDYMKRPRKELVNRINELELYNQKLTGSLTDKGLTTEQEEKIICPKCKFDFGYLFDENE
jgi:hypothetical protein